MAMFTNMIGALRHEISRWLNVPCYPQWDMHSDQRQGTYITYYVVQDWQQFEFKQTSPSFNIEIQFKVVSSDEFEQKELKYKLRRLFSLSEPKEYLALHGLALLRVDYLPSPNNYIENEIIYDDGWDMTFNAYYDDTDFTVSGEIDSVDGNIDVDGTSSSLGATYGKDDVNNGN